MAEQELQQRVVIGMDPHKRSVTAALTGKSPDCFPICVEPGRDRRSSRGNVDGTTQLDPAVVPGQMGCSRERTRNRQVANAKDRFRGSGVRVPSVHPKLAGQRHVSPTTRSLVRANSQKLPIYGTTIDQSALGWTASAQVSEYRLGIPRLDPLTQGHHLEIRTLGWRRTVEWS